MKIERVRVLFLGLFGVLAGMLVLAMFSVGTAGADAEIRVYQTNTPWPTNTPRPPQPTNTPWPTSSWQTPTPVRETADNAEWTYAERFGVSGDLPYVWPARNAGLPFGSYLNWNVLNQSQLPQDVTGWHTLRVAENGLHWSDARIEEAVRARPGATWVIGNEPDVVVQDNVTPASYAKIYNHAYHLIKSVDPTAQVAIAGVSTPTPLRRQYLDMVINAHWQQFGSLMPIDVWTVHVYVLREERDSWGVGIPPGMDWVDQGQLFEIEDHGDFATANRMIEEFRWWMKGKGYGDKPLAVTEFGILMPADFGFPDEVVVEYMRAVVDFYLTAANSAGYSADSNKLVQQWFWFSLYEAGDFSNSNLYDPATGTLTAVGAAWAEYFE